MSGEGEGADGLACEPDDKGPDGEFAQAARKALAPTRQTASVLSRPIANLDGKQSARQID